MVRKFKLNQTQKLGLLVVALTVISHTPSFATGSGPGSAALTTAATQIGGYFPLVKLIAWAGAAVIAMVGGIRIFQKWNSGDHDINKELVMYGGSMLFLIIAPNVISNFFGISAT